jgi:hypothetical protein
MKKLLYLYTLLFSYSIGNAQNLAPNPDFEGYQNCPTGVTILPGTVNSWSGFAGTCDYFHDCATQLSNVDVPSNMPGFQFANSGSAYCGFLVGAIGQPAYREFLGAQLTQPLQVGTRYYVSFYLSLADGSGYRLPMNKQGALFSTVAYDASTNAQTYQNFAHVYTDSIVSDTAGWQRITGSFVADSVYSFVSFGTFFDTSQISTLASWQPFFEAYYYIDDVCISADSLLCNPATGIQHAIETSDVNISPNPFTDELNMLTKNLQEAEVVIFDMTSRILLRKSFSGSVTLETISLSKGIYIYELKVKGKTIKKGKLLKN